MCDLVWWYMLLPSHFGEVEVDQSLEFQESWDYIAKSASLSQVCVCV